MKSKRITLLVIPEESGKTFELKLHRLLIKLGAGICVGWVVLLGLGLKSYLDARSLSRKVVRLEREKSLLEREVEKIERLEQVLQELRESNHQLRAILGESAEMERKGLPLEGSTSESYIPALERLRRGQVQTFPGLWPVEGVVVDSFSGDFPAVVIAVPPRSLVRASGAGQVRRAGFDERLGYRVVLDHGNGLVSRYGYLASLLVEEGELVEKGQPIGLSGSTGTAVRPSLYYAVRERGEPRDPLRYRLWL